jgi:hypothetical protein
MRILSLLTLFVGWLIQLRCSISHRDSWELTHVITGKINSEPYTVAEGKCPICSDTIYLQGPIKVIDTSSD